MKNELIVINKPKSTISEDIRTLRTNLDFSLAANDEKIIMITSSNPSEGKSFTSSNLSVCFAQNDKKVLLIDSDLRLGRTHKIFNISNKLGLSNLILNYNEDIHYEDYIQKTDIKNLFIIPRGIVPPNPSELLSSAKFETILNDLKKIFDCIILDSTPINGLSDALVLTKLADEVVIVCKYGKTSIDDLEECKKTLQTADAKIAGVVIDSMPKTKNKYDYYSE